MRLWFAATAFVGAALLFVVEPMVGKMLLPILGGAPAVWGTCLVFFQVALLAGYAWAHLVTSRIAPGLQPLAHGLLLAAAFASLPLHAPAGAPPPEQAFPIAWLLSRLVATVGLPFVALSATGPLTQRWFASTLDPRAGSPYFLFAASNAGSLVALVAYPILVEPLMTLRTQGAVWSRAYPALLVLLAGCAVAALRGESRQGARSAKRKEMRGEPGRLAAIPPLPWRPWRPGGSLPFRRWLALALVPSALMLAVTTFVTTDVAPVPLLWVVPLALYLASFVIPFSMRPLIGHERVLRWLPASVLVLAFTLVVGADRLLWMVVLLHFAAFFVVALACHGELARTRPAAERLTRFYLVVSAGGAIGGAMVAIVAPLLFPAVWEYPLGVVAACALRAGMPGASTGGGGEDFEELARAEGVAVRTRPGSARVRGVLRRIGPPLGTALVLAGTLRLLSGADETWRVFVVAQLATAACVVAWTWRAQAERFAWMVAAMVLSPVLASIASATLFEGRSFFAVHRVVDSTADERHLYVQGTTIHGLQSTRADKKRVAGAYFHLTGPAGDVLGHTAPARVGLVGLGVASLAAYADSGQSFTFYEIDPVVARIAEDPRLFTFTRDARERGARVDVVLGDARIQLARAPDGGFDALVLDAYSSDVVPAHLLTREAFALYLQKLAPHGFVLMNVSNRYLDLGRVVGPVAAGSGLSVRERLDELSSEDDKRAAREDGKAPSRWIVVARAATDLESLDLGPSWKPLAPSRMRAWSDDYVNVAGCFRF